ncbi:hypothetical protein BC938DRAFT_477887, partial [Jimgerdemannia flammicorona]
MLKIWNIQTTSCIRSIECGYALCSSFLPGNRHVTRNLTMRAFTLHITEYLDPQVILGTKAGELELYDIASSSLLEMIKAHEGPVWSLQVRPDKRGLVTGSADKDIKFWDFDMVEEEAVRILFLGFRLALGFTSDTRCIERNVIHLTRRLSDVNATLWEL